MEPNKDSVKPKRFFSFASSFSLDSFKSTSRKNSVDDQDGNGTGSTFQPLQPPGELLDFRRSARALASMDARYSSSGRGNRAAGGSLVNPLSRLSGQCTRVQDDPVEEADEEDGTAHNNPFMKFLFRSGSSQQQHEGGGQEYHEGRGSPPPMEWSSLEVPDEDDDDVHKHERSRNLRLYLTAAFIIVITIADLVTFFVFQFLARPFEDFTCSSSPDAGIIYNIPQISIMALLILLHLIYIAQRSRSSRERGVYYHRKSWHVFILAASFAILVLDIRSCGVVSPTSFGFQVLARTHMIVHVLRVALLVKMCHTLRQDLRRRLQRAVSLNRRRYVNSDLHLDLDLTYIADRVIAMSIPCVDSAPHRNDIKDVTRFLASQHYGSFAVLNLCQDHEESGNGNYHPSLFFGQVQKAPMRDHNAPAFQTLVDFCEAATCYLNAGDRNIIAVHCQGGKGRTGVFVCALLLWVGLVNTAQEAVRYYAQRRSRPKTPPHKMIRPTSPSQLRYLTYLEKKVVEGFDFAGAHPLFLKRIILNHPPVDQFGWNIAVVIEQGMNIIFDLVKATGSTVVSKERFSDQIMLKVGPLHVDGDMTLRIYSMPSDSSIPKGTPANLVEAAKGIKYGAVKGTQLAFITVHTASLAAKMETSFVTFRKEEIDGIHMDTRHKLFREDFSISLDLDKPPVSPAEVPFKPLHTSLSYHPLVPRLNGRITVSPNKKPAPAPGPPCLLESQDSLSGSFRDLAGCVALADPLAPSSDGEQRSCKPSGADVDTKTKYMLAFSASSKRLSSLSSSKVNNTSHTSTQSTEPVPALSLHEVAQRTCSGVRTFSYGEVVLDTTIPEANTHMTVYYVVSGRIQIEPWRAGPVGGWSGCLGMPDIARFCILPVVFPILYGTSGTNGGRDFGGGLLYKVKSVEAKIAVIRLSPHLHDQVEGADGSKNIDSANMMLYEAIARGLNDWMIDIAAQIALQKKPVPPVQRKAHPSRTTALAARKKMYQRVMTLHSLPEDEKVLTSCQALHVSRKRTNGQLLLFKFSLVFRAQSSIGTNNIAQDVVIPLDQVVDISLKKDLLTIQFSIEAQTDLDSAPSTPQTTGSPMSPGAASDRWLRIPRSPVSVPWGPPLTPVRKKKLLASGQAGSSMRRSSASSRKFSLAPSMPEVSFVITGLGGTESVISNATSIFGKVLRQHSLVKARVERGRDQGSEELESRMALLGHPAEVLMSPQFASAEGLGPEEAMLRRWGLILADEHVSEETMSMLSFLLCEARCQRFSAGQCFVKAGSEEKRLVLIQSGRVAIRSAEGDKLEVRQAGDVVGVKAFFRSGNYGSMRSLVAETDVQVLFIDNEDLECTCQRCPPAGARLYRLLAMNLGTLLSWQFELLGEEEEEDAVLDRRKSLRCEDCSLAHLPSFV